MNIEVNTRGADPRRTPGIVVKFSRLPRWKPTRRRTLILKNLSIRTKLALLLLVAMVFLAGTRGLGLIQLGGYLDRVNSYAVSMDALHQQVEAVQASHLAAVRAGAGSDAAAPQAAHDEKIGVLRGQLQAQRAEWNTLQQRERAIMYSTYVAMLIIVFIVGGGIYWLLMATVVRPLQGMASVANVVAAGDLTQDIGVRSEDEIGKVMQALRDMNGSLSALIGKIRAASQSIGAGTTQISMAGDSLLRHVEGQTDFLQRTATSLRELAAAVTSNAGNAGRARKLAANAREVAIRGGTEVGEAVDTMLNISNSSQKIVDIVSIIDGITFQTNILALNAAVEAARAGEQGRGFAVVASEVRSLAQRSASAAREIADLINASVRDLREGSGLVEKAGATMTQIVGGARAVDDIMVIMAADAEQQRQVIEQVRATVDRVDQSSQQQALLANAASAAESMRLQVQQLMTAVSVFRLSADASTDSTSTIPAADVPRPVRLVHAHARTLRDH